MGKKRMVLGDERKLLTERAFDLGSTDEHLGVVYKTYSLCKNREHLLDLKDNSWLSVSLLNLLVWIIKRIQDQMRAGCPDNRLHPVWYTKLNLRKVLLVRMLKNYDSSDNQNFYRVFCALEMIVNGKWENK